MQRAGSAAAGADVAARRADLVAAQRFLLERAKILAALSQRKPEPRCQDVDKMSSNPVAIYSSIIETETEPTQLSLGGFRRWTSLRSLELKRRVRPV